MSRITLFTNDIEMCCFVYRTVG